MSNDQHLDVSELGNTILVHFKEYHLLSDYAVVNAIGNELDELVDRSRGRKVVIDFSGVEHVSSLILGLLVMFRKQVVPNGGQLLLCRLSPEVRELFDRTVLSQSWDIRESEADAFAVFAWP